VPFKETDPFLRLMATPGIAYSNGTWTIDGTQSRNLLLQHQLGQLPERFEIRFRLDVIVVPDESGRGIRPYPNISLSFIKGDGSAGLYSNWSSTRVQITARSGNGVINIGNRGRVLDFRREGNSLVEIIEGRLCMDVREESVACFFNGAFLGKGKIGGIGKVLADARTFQVSSSVAGLGGHRIGNLRILPWSGILPSETEGGEAGAPAGEDQDGAQRRLSLTNGDYVDGTIKAFQAGGLLLDTVLGEIKLPFERVAVMGLADDGTGEDSRSDSSGVPAVHLRTGGSLTLTGYRLEDKHLVVTHPVLGEVRIPWALVSEMAFAQGQ
jgi:hypothetical protein